MITLDICWCLDVAVAAPSTLFLSCDSWVILVGYLCFKGCSLLCSTVYICLMSSIGSSCVVIGDLSVTTLVGLTVSGILGGSTLNVTLVGEIVGTYLGNTLVYVFPGCTVLNIRANLLMACNWHSPIVKGVCGPGFLITCSSSLAALVACCASDNHGMMRCCGKNSTTYACLSPLVLGL